MSKTKPWNIKDGVYEEIIKNTHTQTLEEIRKKGLGFVEPCKR